MTTLSHPPSTPTPLDAVRAFRTIASPHRFRVIRDAEGWPVIPGRRGQIEWHCDGRTCHGCPVPGPLLAVWTDHRCLEAKLGAIPGMLRWQPGDAERRALFPPEALEQVAGVIRARRRRLGRPLTSDQALRMRARARVSATSAA